MSAPRRRGAGRLAGMGPTALLFGLLCSCSTFREDLQRADDRAARSEYDQALSAYADLLKEYPADPLVRSHAEELRKSASRHFGRLGGEALDRGEPAEALRLLERSLVWWRTGEVAARIGSIRESLNRRDMDLQLRKARDLASAGQVTESAEAYRALLRRHPSFEGGREAALELEYAFEAGKAAVSASRALMDSGRSAAASARLEKLSPAGSMTPGVAGALERAAAQNRALDWDAKARSAFRQGDFDAAREIWARAAEQAAEGASPLAAVLPARRDQAADRALAQGSRSEGGRAGGRQWTAARAWAVAATRNLQDAEARRRLEASYQSLSAAWEFFFGAVSALRQATSIETFREAAEALRTLEKTQADLAAAAAHLRFAEACSDSLRTEAEAASVEAGDPLEASERALQAFRLSPRASSLELYSRSRVSGLRRSHLEEGDRALGQARPASARRHFESALLIGERSDALQSRLEKAEGRIREADAWFRRGREGLEHDRLAEARDAFARAHAFNQEHPLALEETQRAASLILCRELLDQGKAREAAGDYAGAETLYRKAHETCPQEEALKHLERARNALEARSRLETARSRIREGSLYEAWTAALQAAVLDPQAGRDTLREAEGRMKDAQGLLIEAFQDVSNARLESALAKGRRVLDLWTRQEDALRLVGELEASLREIEEETRKAASDLDRRNLDEAGRKLLHLLAVQPEHAEVRRLWGELDQLREKVGRALDRADESRKRRDWQRALSSLKEAVDIDAGNPVAEHYRREILAEPEYRLSRVHGALILLSCFMAAATAAYYLIPTGGRKFGHESRDPASGRWSFGLHVRKVGLVGISILLFVTGPVLLQALEAADASTFRAAFADSRMLGALLGFGAALAAALLGIPAVFFLFVEPAWARSASSASSGPSSRWTRYIVLASALPAVLLVGEAGLKPYPLAASVFYGLTVMAILGAAWQFNRREQQDLDALVRLDMGAGAGGGGAHWHGARRTFTVPFVGGLLLMEHLFLALGIYHFLQATPLEFFQEPPGFGRWDAVLFVLDRVFRNSLLLDVLNIYRIGLTDLKPVSWVGNAIGHVMILQADLVVVALIVQLFRKRALLWLWVRNLGDEVEWDGAVQRLVLMAGMGYPVLRVLRSLREKWARGWGGIQVENKELFSQNLDDAIRQIEAGRP
jgi:tetratricopeptide (TPR) repeat protein